MIRTLSLLDEQLFTCGHTIETAMRELDRLALMVRGALSALPVGPVSPAPVQEAAAAPPAHPPVAAQEADGRSTSRNSAGSGKSERFRQVKVSSGKSFRKTASAPVRKSSKKRRAA